MLLKNHFGARRRKLDSRARASAQQGLSGIIKPIRISRRAVLEPRLRNADGSGNA
jgi:hypothetical protein